MGFFRFNTDPEKRQAKLNVSLSASPILSISDPNAALRLTPLTLCIEGGILEQVNRGDGYMDIFARGGFTSLRSTGDNGDVSKNIALGRGYRMQFHSDSDAEDLLERGSRFLTVPPSERENLEKQQDAAAAAAATATITHELDWKRIFRFEDTRTRDDLVPGEKFEISMNDDSIGTNWWCWGDLDRDLKGKKLHIWHEHEGYYGEEKPQKDNSWVLGEDPMHLDWEDITPGRKAIFTIVE
ncbi:hypothetical protein PG999_004038 [Apiospora kogelbergensis]|uniref:Uncharacterized protein n=1 Tax=Apiospora kogelbergensis TaxID=1337665 RepID=A0AAW0R5D0_9PEZI